MDDFNKTAKGIVTEDPAITAPIGQELKFNPVTIHHEFQENAVWLKEWESFEGTLLLIHFADNEFHSVEGSGVLVAPGVALCANHVIEPNLKRIMAGELSTVCTAITSNGIFVWRPTKITPVPNSDLVILGLVFASELPSDNTFNQVIISTRFPKIGEKLLITGFRASDIKYEKGVDNHMLIPGNVLACSGEITQRYPQGRDSSMLPWPSLEVDCPTWGGMSGGPVFDSDGLLVGLLTSSFDSGPSYVSLLWPALGTQFEGGWPVSLFKNRRTLIDMTPLLCAIDNPAAIEIIKSSDNGNSETINYRIWE